MYICMYIKHAKHVLELALTYDYRTAHFVIMQSADVSQM